MIAMSDMLYRRLEVKFREDDRKMSSIMPMSSLMGLRVIRSPHVPKAKIPVRPNTDDMRSMVDDLVGRGEARPQFKEREQAFFFSTAGIARVVA
jgi:hypothetical protein